MSESIPLGCDVVDLSRPRLQIVRGVPGCLPGETEVMTPGGWVRIDSYKTGTKILQWDSVYNKARFIEPQNYIVGACDSFVEFDCGKHFKMTVTGNHRVPLYNLAGRFLVKTADQLGKHPSKHTVPTTWANDCDGIGLTDDMLRLWVAICADGHYYKVGKKCEFCFRKNRKVERLIALLDRMSIKYTITDHYRDDKDGKLEKRIRIDRPDLPKHFDWRLSQCNEHQARVITDEVKYWDGYFSEDYDEFSTTVSQDADIIQYLYHCCGRNATIRCRKRNIPNHSDAWRVVGAQYNSFRNHVQIRCDDVKVKTVENKNGSVYCFETDTGFFVVRQSGHIFVTGNSGKSTLARKYPCIHLELDQYCCRAGAYRWGESRDKAGQEWLQVLVHRLMKEGLDIVVSGVLPIFRKRLGWLLYWGMKCGYEVWVKDLFGSKGNGTIHGVRLEDQDWFARNFMPFDKDQMAHVNRFGHEKDEVRMSENEALAFEQYVADHVHIGLMPIEYPNMPEMDGFGI